MTLVFLAYDANDSNSMNQEELKSLLKTVYLVNGMDLEQNALVASVEACLSMILPEDDTERPNVRRSLRLEKDDDGSSYSSNDTNVKTITLKPFIELHKFQPLILKCFSLSLFESDDK